MTAKLKLGWCMTVFLGALMLSTSVSHRQPASIVEWNVPTAPQLTQEQVALVGHLADKYRQPRPTVERIVRSAYLEGRNFGLSPLLILAIIEKESSFKLDAYSTYGAVGLMQVVPRFHREKLLAKEDARTELSNPENNIRVGSRILAEVVDSTGSLTAALRKYSGNARNYTKLVEKFRRELELVQTEGKSLDA